MTQKISGLEIASQIPPCRELKGNIRQIRKIRRALALASVSQNHENAIINNLMYFVNLVVLYDFFVYTLTISSVHSNLDTARLCYLAVGSVDASVATASYIHRHTDICNPQFNDQMTLELQNAYHPLLTSYVPNSYPAAQSSALITGSNMAGKTTFIKTVGVNYILARGLWLCHATSAQFPVLNIHSSIKTEDGLEEGKSFYFSELERLKEFVRLTTKGEHCIFLIDEIYRGTNTVERIAGAAAVLQNLAQSNIVMVTTHDIELTRFLSKQYGMWHFEETGNVAEPFDYKLRPGVCTTRNAIKLMSNIGYPDHITESARSVARVLESES